jgi:Zn-finger nucleic acid-binding protein
MDTGHRSCPGCSAAMVARQVARGAVLHLCPDCGGTFADGGALERALGQPLAQEALEGHTERRCAFCRITMTPALLGSIPVEVCTACTGLYLDHGELEELAPELDLPARPSPTPHPAPELETTGHPGGFVCASCGRQTPFSHGNATARGLVCRGCVIRPGTTEQERLEANGEYRPSFQVPHRPTIRRRRGLRSWRTRTSPPSCWWTW